MTRHPAFSSPMNHAVEVEQLEHEGVTVAVGDTISFDYSVFVPRTTGQSYLRGEAVIVELWVEDWRGTPLPYAETLTSSDEYHRVWFHRDHIGAVAISADRHRGRCSSLWITSMFHVASL